MRTIAFTHRTWLWLLVTALVGGASVASVETVGAQVPPTAIDHLKCYRIITDTNPVGTNTVTMRTPQLNATQQCTVQKKASYLCVETIKLNVNGEPRGDDPRGGRAEDFLCYQMTCPSGPIRDIRVDDQFNVTAPRRVQIRNAQLFCTPTNKQVAPTTAEEEELLEKELLMEEELEENSR